MHTYIHAHTHDMHMCMPALLAEACAPARMEHLRPKSQAGEGGRGEPCAFAGGGSNPNQTLGELGTRALAGHPAMGVGASLAPTWVYLIWPAYLNLKGVCGTPGLGSVET